MLAGIERGGGGVAEQVVGDFQRGEGVVGPRGDEAIAVGVGEERCVVAGVVDDGHGADVVGSERGQPERHEDHTDHQQGRE